MRIKVPATSANLGPGFDTLGMALRFYNHFEANPADAMAVRLSPSTCVEVSGLSLSVEDNLFAQAYQAYFRYRGAPLIPAELVIEAHLPLSRGLGSSSSAIVAGMLLADSLHPDPLGKEALLPWLIEMEGHPDNVVPALLGGVRCCLGNQNSFALAWPKDWGILLLIPPAPVSTHEARAVMPPHYTQTEAVETLRGIAAWIQAVSHANANLFRYALQVDKLHQPARSRLIPEFKTLQSLIAQTEALGCVISGSGSTLAMFTPHSDGHREIETLLKSSEALAHCRILTVQPDTTGAQISS